MALSPGSKRSGSARADDRGRAAIDFIEQCCVHTIGKWAGDPFILAPWQREFVYEIFANVDPRTGLRLTRRAFLAIARKNGKSELAAAVALYLLLADGEQSPQVYGAAFDRDQASIVFDVAAQMVHRSEELRGLAKVIPSTKRIICPDNGGFYRAIPADAAGSHGFNASGIVFDEFHTQKNRDLYDVLSTSTGARDQPLIFMITTAGFNRESICHDVYEYARKVIDGRVSDKTFVGRLYEIPQGTSFEELSKRTKRGRFVREKDLWPLANPSLVGQPGGFLKPDEIRRAVAEATHMPAAQNHVLNLHFNVWTDASMAWLPMAQWDACGHSTSPDAIAKRNAGRACWGGLDLSSTSDFTALSWWFPADDGDGAEVLTRLWIPEAALERRARMRDDLRAWARQGFVTFCPGPSIDYRAVAAQIAADCHAFDVQALGYDPWHAPHIITLLDEFDLDKIEMVKVSQYASVMNAPCRLYEKMIADGTLDHGGSPVLRWMAGNVVAEVNPYEAMRPSKKRSSDSIDGITSQLIALERCMAPREAPAFAGVVI